MVQIGAGKVAERDVDGDKPQPAENQTAETEMAEKLPATVSGGSAAIASRLRQAILDSNYSYGERLPAERELAEHFGASRSTVREALRRLEEAHLVTRRIGSGTFVSHRPSLGDGNIAELTSPLELIDVRLGIEPTITRLAVIHATARDLDRMGEALQRVETSGDDSEAFSRADEQFHLLLAECTHNPLMVWLYQQINDVRSHAQWNSMKDKILTGNRIGEYNKEHRQLYEALRSRDVEGAVGIINRHLEKARRHLMGVDL